MSFARVEKEQDENGEYVWFIDSDYGRLTRRTLSKLYCENECSRINLAHDKAVREAVEKATRPLVEALEKLANDYELNGHRARETAKKALGGYRGK